MRLAFLVLLLLNAMLFVWGQGYWSTQSAGRESERLSRQLLPERLHILSADGKAAAAPPPPSCRRIEGLSQREGELILAAIAALSGWRGRLLPRVEEPAHWVLIGNLPDRPSAEKKRAELRQLGIHESEIVEDADHGPFVVSLGVFRSPQLAQEHLQSLAKKGVRSAKLARRELPPLRFALELSAPAGELAGKLPELVAGLPAITLADCANP
ncbi:MAG: SPOR domain-containing protein [Rhodocyclaceae bacterium]|nr:SPOR domain-containing protein [Rhodocyclaceae bacterium]